MVHVRCGELFLTGSAYLATEKWAQMTLLTAHRVIRETRMQPVVEAVYTVLRFYTGRMDEVIEEQGQIAGDTARQDVAIRSLRKRIELLEGLQREERKKE